MYGYIILSYLILPKVKLVAKLNSLPVFSITLFSKKYNKKETGTPSTKPDENPNHILQ